ncbi:unnamed protein product [Notodromas monacha]|uniref:Uncharacterized protein n=1 Tax=Notodromas monacha TaxID=399045 RepID=A0A7R9BU11_9CRUS|nr:unnamed protein product [Notodromas monacha]CAG0920676.1 unnamed protein product [Notodromas monacha]
MVGDCGQFHRVFDISRLDIVTMVMKIYISGISGNKEVKKRQQRVTMILDSRHIAYELIDITEPGREEEKDFMQQNSTPLPGAKYALPPQIFKDDVYCGDYDQYDLSNENDELEKFLKLTDEEIDALKSASTPRASPAKEHITAVPNGIGCREVSVEKDSILGEDAPILGPSGDNLENIANPLANEDEDHTKDGEPVECVLFCKKVPAPNCVFVETKVLLGGSAAQEQTMATPNEQIVQSEMDKASPSPSSNSASAFAQNYRNNNQWAHLMLPAIRSYCATAQIPHLGNQDKLVAALQTQGVQPINVLQNTAPGPGASPSAAELTANITKLLLLRRADFPKQAQGEDFKVYLRQLEIAFSHDGTSNNTKIDCLIGHTTPTVKAAAQRLYDKGYHNYNNIADRLKIQFGLLPFEHFTRFLALRPLKDKSWAQFGNRLRCEYICYLPLSATDLPGQERSITPPSLVNYWQSPLEGSTPTYTPRQPPIKPSHGSTNTQQGNHQPKTTASGLQKHYCDHHQQYVLHTTAKCSLGQNPRPNTATGNQSPRNLQSCTYHPGCLVAHSTADCQNNPANQVTRRPMAQTREMPRSGSDAVLRSIPQDTDDSLTIIIGIKDKRVPALINTGATRSFMATNVTAEVGLTPHLTKAKISAAVLHISADISHSESKDCSPNTSHPSRQMAKIPSHQGASDCRPTKYQQ